MRLFKLTPTKIDIVKALANGKNDNLYYSVPHGNRGNGLYCYYMSIAATYAKPEKRSDTLELTGDTFFLKPIRDKKTKKITRDNKNNVLYYIGKENSFKEDNAILLFWHIPYTGYQDIQFKISGACDVIAIGTAGKERGDVSIKAPAPIIEITGSCQLVWSALRISDQVQIEQTITYDLITDNFTIDPIKPKEV